LNTATATTTSTTATTAATTTTTNTHWPLLIAKVYSEEGFFNSDEK